MDEITPERIEAAYDQMMADLTDHPHVPHTHSSESPLSKETNPMSETHAEYVARVEGYDKMIGDHYAADLARIAASEARHGGRMITQKLAERVVDFRRPDAYQTIVMVNPRDPEDAMEVPVWIAALDGRSGEEELRKVWSYMIDPAYGTKETGWGWMFSAQSAARGYDASARPMHLSEAEAMLDWPILRAAFVASVFVYRHPDAELNFTTEGLVEVVDVDMGSSFNGQPNDAEEREIARDMADGLEERAKTMPLGAARDAALSSVEELRELGECPHDVVTDTQHRLGMLYGICAECDEDLVQTGEEDEAGVPGWEVVSE